MEKIDEVVKCLYKTFHRKKEERKREKEEKRKRDKGKKEK